MPRRFNTAGPCKADLHYTLPSARRLPRARELIEAQAYFVIHAPRQTGKTTALLALAEALNSEGRFVAAVVSVEAGQPFDDPTQAVAEILDAWRGAAQRRLPPDLRPPPWPAGTTIGGALQTWAQASPRPLVVFIDEIDSLAPSVLALLLRRVRDGFPDRPRSFPWSIALVGMRDVRDYAIAAGGTSRRGGGSPFNISEDSLLLADFSPDDVRVLLEQHTEETGQAFEPDAVSRIVHLTHGQPWLVNALARQCIETVVPDRARCITAEDVGAAKEILILRQDTHLDSLAERLREPRVRRIIEPILAGGVLPDVSEDDRRFVLDLGLVRQDRGGILIANPIYQEVIPRALAANPQASLPEIAPSWLRADGALDTDALLQAFITFWRQHGEALLASAPYHEIAPHLVLMAFLHRVVNGGGTIEREYAIGSGRMDLCVRYRDVTLGIEIKVWRDGRPDPLAEGLAQIDRYLARLGQAKGWLVVFDRRDGHAPRSAVEAESTPAGRAITVVRA